MFALVKLASQVLPSAPEHPQPAEAGGGYQASAAPTRGAQKGKEQIQLEVAPRYIAREDMIDRMIFWREFWPNYGKFKFSPYGQSSLHVPTFHRKNIEKIAQEARDVDFQYAPSGRNDLKDAIIQHFPMIKEYTASGIEIHHNNLVITSGAVPGIALAIEALCAPGDEVIMFEPIYPYHLSKLILRQDTKLRVVRMKYNKAKKLFEFDYEALKRALSPKTKVVLLTNPNNPTTRVFTMEEHIAISNILHPYKHCVVIEDMAYAGYHEDLHLPVPYGSIQPLLFERSLAFYSCGELFNATGMRVGFAVGGHSLIETMLKYFPYDLHIVPSFEQMVCRDNFIAANEPYEGAKSFYEHSRKDISKRAKRIEIELAKHGIDFIATQGTYYAILDIEKLRGKIRDKYHQMLDRPGQVTKHLDKAFCRMLFIQAYIGAFPLSCMYFGEDVPDNFVRITLNKNDADLDSLIEAMQNLDLIK